MDRQQISVGFVERAVIFFIGPESDHWLCLSLTALTHELTDLLPFSKLD